MSRKNTFLSYCKIENFTKFIFFNKNKNSLVGFNSLELNPNFVFSKVEKCFFDVA